MPHIDCKPLPTLTEDEIEKFFIRIDYSPGHGPKGECWPWIGAKSGEAYGQFTIQRDKPRCLKATRVAYKIYYGKDPYPYVVMHSCDWPPCVNPEHLSIGTQVENQLDCTRKGRRASGDKQGLRLHPEAAARGLRNGKYTKPESTRRGEAHPHSKLTKEDIINIRNMYATGIYTLSQIGDKFSVQFCTVHAIVKRRAWKHVP